MTSPDTSTAEVVAWRYRWREANWVPGAWSDWAIITKLPQDVQQFAYELEPLVPKSALDTSRAETAAANARAEALERERDETVLGSMLDIYRQRAEVDADQMAKLEAKLAKAVEAGIALADQAEHVAVGTAIEGIDLSGAAHRLVERAAEFRALAEIEGKSK